MSSVRSQERGARWILGAPLLAALALLIAYPLGYGVYTALQNKTLLNPTTRFTGLDNVTRVLSDGSFWHAVAFTAKFTAISTATEMCLGFGLALLFDRRFPGKQALLTATLLPIMIAPALMGVMFRLLLNGDIGTLPALLRILGLHLSLFAESTVVPLLITLDVLQWTPFTMLLLYSGLQTVPRELYEAAAVDGAGYWRTIRSVTLPVLAPIIFIASFLRAIDAFRTFDVIYVLTGGGPGDATATMSIYIYKAFANGNFGVAAAASLIASVLLVPVVPIIIRRLLPQRP